MSLMEILPQCFHWTTAGSLSNPHLCSASQRHSLFSKRESMHPFLIVLEQRTSLLSLGLVDRVCGEDELIECVL